jgi:ABC-type branched-subunit amino acid transport system ATPase component
VSALAIEAVNVIKRYGGVAALDGTSLSVVPKHVHGVIGPNGAGKTTLLNVLSGVTRATEGKCRYFDTDVTRWSLRRFVQSARVVRTFQTVRLFETMTVRQNIAVAAGARIEHERHALTVKPAARTRAEELIGSFELGSVADSIVTNLPYGTRRTVELARALATEPEVLLLDEPAAGLTPAERDQLGRRIRSLSDDGITVVLVEHQMDLVSSVCDHLTVLDFGKVICDGTPGEVIRDPLVTAAYLGDVGDGELAHFAPTTPRPVER